MKVRLIFLVILLMTNQSVFAGGSTGVGGGGDIIILPDDSIALADPWINHSAIQPNNMPSLHSLNPRILQSINAYYLAVRPVLNELGVDHQSDIAELLRELSYRENKLRFYAVQSANELNIYCASGGKKVYTLPSGASIQQVACTAGDETFVIEPLFLRLNLREQSLLLIHERLTTLRNQFGGKNYSAIANFTTGLRTYLNLYSEQSSKKYRSLTDKEQNYLNDFYISIEELERRNSEINEDSFQWKAHKYGGGIVHQNSRIDANALVDITSFIPKESTIMGGAKIINTRVPPNITLNVGKNSQVSNTIFYWLNIVEGKVIRPNMDFEQIDRQTYKKPNARRDSFLNLGDNSILSNSSIINLLSSYEVSANTTIDKSKINFEEFTVGENSQLLEVDMVGVKLNIGKNVEIIKSQIELLYYSWFYPLTKLENINKISDGEKLKNGVVNGFTYRTYFPFDAQLKPIKASLTVPTVSCEFENKLPTNASINLNFLNENNEGVRATGTIVPIKKTGVFRKVWSYSYNIQLSVDFTKLPRVFNNSNLMLSESGHFGFSEFLIDNPISITINGNTGCPDIIKSIRNTLHRNLSKIISTNQTSDDGVLYFKTEVL